MSIYLDSAIIQEAETAMNFGWVFGITTNPTLLAKSPTPPEETLSKLGSLGAREVYCQVSSSTIPEMTAEMQTAEKILGDKLVVKIPPTQVGFEFAAKISSSHKICLTAIYHPAQALVAREIGAAYIAIYVNRATRLIGDGIAVTKSIAQTLEGSQTEILAASIKSTDEAIAAFNAGAQHLALPFQILTALIEHPLSTQAVEEFNQNGTYL